VATFVAIYFQKASEGKMEANGEVIARLVPISPTPPPPVEMAAVLADLNQLSAEISAQWPNGVSALEAINDVRREYGNDLRTNSALWAS
jgi:hypothetical protein